MQSDFRPLSDICFEIGRQLCSSGPGVFVEAGAFDGVTQSNTYLLERKLHWRGLLVEPSPKFSELVGNRSKENFFLHAGLTRLESERTLTGLFNGTLTDTADPSLVEFFIKANPTTSVREATRRLVRDFRRKMRGWKKTGTKVTSEVPGVTLAEAIARSGFQHIDLMSIDVEGMELKVLYGNDWLVRPRVLVIETRSRDALEMIEILTDNQYELIARHGTEAPRKNSDYLEFSNLFWSDSRDSGASAAIRDAFAS